MKPQLSDPSLLKSASYVAGRWTTGAADKLAVTNPATGEVVAEVGTVDRSGTEEAIAVAHEAMMSWRAVPAKTRAQVLRRWFDLMMTHQEDLAIIMTTEQGKTLAESRGEVAYGAAFMEWFGEQAKRIDGDVIPAPSHDKRVICIKQPVGVVAAITPWNFPNAMIARKAAPALAAGCTVVHKPAEWSPYTAALLVEIMHDAGLPAGVLNTVHGFGETAGKALTEHPAIKAVAFVGESVTGSQIMKQGADTLKRVHFELGGKNAVIVFADADMERALDAVVFMIYSLNGERCTSSSRLLIESSVKEEFLERLSGRVANLRVGHPLDPETEVGPLIHPRHFEKVCSYFDIAREDGATVAVGGAPALIDGKGNFVQPTLFIDASADMRISQEEIFGPVLTAISFDSEDEAVELANGVAYGLAGYVWTADAGRGVRMARDLDVGMVWVNSENNRHLPTPFGGMKASGIGRDGGDYSFDFYMETKNVCIATNEHSVPELGM